jgi:hypothetical protein
MADGLRVGRSAGQFRSITFLINTMPLPLSRTALLMPESSAMRGQKNSTEKRSTHQLKTTA